MPELAPDWHRKLPITVPLLVRSAASIAFGRNRVGLLEHVRVDAQRHNGTGMADAATDCQGIDRRSRSAPKHGCAAMHGTSPRQLARLHEPRASRGSSCSAELGCRRCVLNTSASASGFPCPSANRNSSWRRRCARRASTAIGGNATTRRPCLVFGALNLSPALVCSRLRSIRMVPASRSTSLQRSARISPRLAPELKRQHARSAEADALEGRQHAADLVGLSGSRSPCPRPWAA